MFEIKVVGRNVDSIGNTTWSKKVLYQNMIKSECDKNLWMIERILVGKYYDSPGEYLYIKKVIERILDGYEVAVTPEPRRKRRYEVEIDYLNSFGALEDF